MIMNDDAPDPLRQEMEELCRKMDSALEQLETAKEQAPSRNGNGRAETRRKEAT